MAKQTTITIEISSLFVLHAGNSSRAWCPRCKAEVEMIAFGNTTVIPNLAVPLGEWLNSGELHHSEGPDRSARICLNSLLARLRTRTLATDGGVQH